MVLDCSREELEKAMAEFDSLCAAWHGKQAAPISTSCGVVVCKNPHLNFAAIIDMADRRMYEDK